MHCQHTSPELLALMERARSLPPPSPADRRAQRRSYVVAEMGMGTDEDEAAYRTALAADDTATIVRLDAEAHARMEAGARLFDQMYP